jgi:hypothetical protein
LGQLVSDKEKTMPVLSRVTKSAVGASLVIAALLGATTVAAAANGRVGVRETVCADSLSVRTQPGGAWFDTLTSGQTFLVDRVIPGWAHGFAYGHINHDGWVQDGWFC